MEVKLVPVRVRVRATRVSSLRSTECMISPNLSRQSGTHRALPGNGQGAGARLLERNCVVDRAAQQAVEARARRVTLARASAGGRPCDARRRQSCFIENQDQRRR